MVSITSSGPTVIILRVLVLSWFVYSLLSRENTHSYLPFFPVSSFNSTLDDFWAREGSRGCKVIIRSCDSECALDDSSINSSRLDNTVLGPKQIRYWWKGASSLWLWKVTGVETCEQQRAKTTAPPTSPVPVPGAHTAQATVRLSRDGTSSASAQQEVGERNNSQKQTTNWMDKIWEDMNPEGKGEWRKHTSHKILPTLRGGGTSKTRKMMIQRVRSKTTRQPWGWDCSSAGRWGLSMWELLSLIPE